ncbi:MAG: ABC transporter permease [Thermoproteota archaeon]|nr:ABC transporter permease [Candidatus Brockarchaeota archaeon]
MDIVTSLLLESIKASTPLLLATLGEIYTERSGILNLGIEGIMAIGAFTGFFVAYTTRSLPLSLLAAATIGILLSSLHAISSITFKANQTVSGLALAMLGLGISSVAGSKYVGLPLTLTLQPIRIPYLASVPIAGAFFNQDFLVYFSLILSIFMWFFLNRTKYGLQIIAVGENPSAADASGINVELVRYLCTLFGGALEGLAGAYISLAYLPGWIDGMTQGRGWIAIALTVLSLWDPLKGILVALAFGSIDALQYVLQPYGIPVSLLNSLPYVVTIVVMAVATILLAKRRVRPPSALGTPYIRE